MPRAGGTCTRGFSPDGVDDRKRLALAALGDVGVSRRRLSFPGAPGVPAVSRYAISWVGFPKPTPFGGFGESGRPRSHVIYCRSRGALPRKPSLALVGGRNGT
jgi:hypothetical protein